VISTHATGNGSKEAAIDSNGNAWLANAGSNDVAKVTPAGVVTTYAVATTKEPRNLAFAANGDLWIATWGGGAGPADIYKMSAAGTVTGGPYTVGGTATDIAVDQTSGNVWVSNRGDNKLYQLGPAGNVIGSYTVGSLPYHLRIDASGNAWCANWGGNSISKVTPAGVVTTTAVGGAFNPQGTALDGLGNLWVGGDNRVFKFDANANLLATYTVDGVVGALTARIIVGSV